MKRLLVVIAWALVPILVSSSLAQTGDGYVGIYADAAGTVPCTNIPNYTGTTLYVIAKTAGESANGITGAEFRIEVTDPSGWYLSYTPPGTASIVMGNPIDTDPDPNAGGGVNLGFPSCQVPDSSGQVRFGTLSVFNASGSATDLLVKRHSQPTNPDFGCALFVRCDDPYYTKVCMTSAPPDSCTLGTQKTGLAAVEDPAYFVAALNEGNGSDPDPDPELPDNGPQLLAMIKDGIVSFPPGETRASLAGTTIRSAQLATVLASHDVQVIAKAFPSFDLADTVGTARTGETVRLMNYSRIYRLILPSQGDAEALRTDLRPIPEVLFVHHDGGVGLDGSCTFDSIPSCVTTVTNCPNDSLFAEQWALVNWEQSAGACDADIDADEAWELTTGTPTVKIGVFDTGIFYEHEDVAGKATGEMGHTNPVEHGTFVACIAAANTNNLKGIAGLDHNARLVAKLLPQHTTEAADSIIVRKVREAATESLHVLNNSWYLSWTPCCVPGRFSDTVRGAFRDYYMSNGVAVASMGNEGLRGSPVQYPAAFGQGIIAVGATNNRDEIAEFSSWGDHIGVAAPGVLILSCFPMFQNPTTLYNTWEGTSFAAPHVAGLAGLLFSYAELYNDDVEQIIRLSAEDKGPAGPDSIYGTGRINARAALDGRVGFGLRQRELRHGLVRACRNDHRKLLHTQDVRVQPPGLDRGAHRLGADGRRERQVRLLGPRGASGDRRRGVHGGRRCGLGAEAHEQESSEVDWAAPSLAAESGRHAARDLRRVGSPGAGAARGADRGRHARFHVGREDREWAPSLFRALLGSAAGGRAGAEPETGGAPVAQRRRVGADALKQIEEVIPMRLLGQHGVLASRLLVALLVSGVSQVAGQPPWVFPIHHESPSWSSTGLIAYQDRGIVYVDSLYGSYLRSDSLAGIWVLDPGSGEKRRVLPWGLDVDWSPDGTQLLVSTGQIYTVNADGTGLRRLTSAGRNFFPAWSPDGEWIAFDSNYTLPLDAIWIMRSDGSERQVIGPTGARMPEWRPDGSLIVHVRDGLHIATMTTQGDDIRQLTTNGGNSHPEYSPDGSHIACERKEPIGLPQVWLMNADGSDQRQLTTRGGGSPSWSPDGRKIVFVREDWTRDDPELGVLWVIDVATGEETQLTHQWPEQCATWPDCDTATDEKSWSHVKELYRRPGL
jgi:subtilisin family serine protease